MNRLEIEKSPKKEKKRKRIAKALAPLLEPLRGFKGVRAELSNVPLHNEKSLNDLSIKAYLLFRDKSSMPKYLLLRQRDCEMPYQIIADVKGSKHLLVFDLDENIEDSNAYAKVATYDIVINDRHVFRIVPVASSFIITEPAEQKQTETRPAGLLDADVRAINANWRTSLKSMFNENAKMKKISISARNKKYDLMLITDKQKFMLFVKDNNLENLTDVSPAFLALDISTKCVMNVDGCEYYGAEVSGARVKHLVSAIRELKQQGNV